MIAEILDSDWLIAVISGLFFQTPPMLVIYIRKRKNSGCLNWHEMKIHHMNDSSNKSSAYV